MSPLDAALVFVAERLPGFDDDRRHDVVATTREAAASAGALARVAEVGSLLALWLRLRARRTPRLLVRGALLGLALAAALASAPLPVAVAVPVALVALGWFDPRYAAAACAVWTWRFVAGGFADFAFLRLLAMAVGILVAVTVAQASLRRLTLR
ncbi:MAG TPA: hypothetical protein VHF47_06450 [Acidimicrobiales bacterium]|nr:hypothetical protein [Acidimicrobiales bacterium]